SNYFVLTTGQALFKGRLGDFHTDLVDVDNVIRELKRSGKTWRAYADGVPGPDRANLAPVAQFSDDLAHDRLANYSFFVPNLFDDAHDVKGTNGSHQG